jgi:aminoglycoside phosphotransferase (APT) family kinase protein
MRQQLSSEAVGGYLVRRGVFTAGDDLDVEELTGGVACAVFAVRGEGKRVVVKQALERFRVADEWLVPPERAVAEAQALELMAQLAPGSVPRLLDSDREAFALVMEEAPAGWRPWKALLLEGVADAAVAAWLGALLAVVHSADGDIGSAESFEAQRVDPYLRTIQQRHPKQAGRIGAYIDQLLDTTECVVHGDYSPKNVLVGDDGLWVIDWEVAHRGDPAFDLAFLLNHLLLKTIHRPQARDGYEACGLAFLDGYGRHLEMPYVLGLVGCLMLARVDGKSPAEYLTEPKRAQARTAGIALLTDPPESLQEAWAGLRP